MLTTLNVTYSNKSLPKLKNPLVVGEWTTLYCGRNTVIGQGELVEVPLGITVTGVQPEDEVLMVLLNSICQRKHIICPVGFKTMTGDYDKEWTFPVMGLEDTMLYAGEPICKFRLIEKQFKLDIYEAEEEENGRN